MADDHQRPTTNDQRPTTMIVGHQGFAIDRGSPNHRGLLPRDRNLSLSKERRASHSRDRTVLRARGGMGGARRSAEDRVQGDRPLFRALLPQGAAPPAGENRFL